MCGTAGRLADAATVHRLHKFPVRINALQLLAVLAILIRLAPQHPGERLEGRPLPFTASGDVYDVACPRHADTVSPRAVPMLLQ